MSTALVVSITEELVAELEALASKSTPGPWGYDGSYVCTVRNEGETVYVQSWDPVADALLSKNVHYIATANPATILALLRERAEMQQQLRAAMISVDNCELFRKDAERYQWLCDGNGYFMEEEFLCGHYNEKGKADAAIDAAMQEQKQ